MINSYELSMEDVRLLDWVTSEVKKWLNTLKSNLKNNEDASEVKSKEINDLFYEINDKKVVLKMDIVKNYLEKIKNKEWADLQSEDASSWIMAVQIALRSPQIWWKNYDNYWKIIIDGSLGWNTTEAVKKFQEANGLKVDGLPGKNTLNKICDILDWNAGEWVWWNLRWKWWEIVVWNEDKILKEEQYKWWKTKEKKETWMYALSHDDFVKYFEWEQFKQMNIGNCWALATIDSLVSFWDYEKLIRKSVSKNDDGFLIRLPLWAPVWKSKSYPISFEELNQKQWRIDWSQSVLVEWKQWIKALLFAYWKQTTWKDEFDYTNFSWWWSDRAFNDLIYWMHVYYNKRSLWKKDATEKNDPMWTKDEKFVNNFKAVLENFDSKKDMLAITVNQSTEKDSNRQLQSSDNYSKLGHYSKYNHVISVEAVKKVWWNLIVTLSNPWDSGRAYDISFNELLKSCWDFSLCSKEPRKWLWESDESYKWKREDASSREVNGLEDVHTINQEVQLTWKKDEALRDARWDIVVTGNDVLTVSSFGLKTQLREKDWKIIIGSWKNAFSIDKKYLSNTYKYKWEIVKNDSYPLHLYWAKIANFINRMKHDYINPKKWANDSPFSFSSKWYLCFNEWWTSSMWGFIRSLYKWSETLTVLKSDWKSALWITSNVAKKNLVNHLNTLYSG